MHSAPLATNTLIVLVNHNLFFAPRGTALLRTLFSKQESVPLLAVIALKSFMRFMIVYEATQDAREVKELLHGWQ
ncbi:hypothetical protein HDU91_003216, partial [Kappamyces sp. JEL0680]